MQVLYFWRQREIRLILFSLLGFPLLFSGSNLALKFTLSGDTVRNQIVPALEQKLGRKVTIDKVEVSLFSGIEITNLTIGNPEGFSPAPLLQARRITLKYELLPLLWKKVVVRGAAVSEPAIFIEKGPNGAFNFDGLDRKASETKPAEGGKPAKGGGNIKMAVSEASLENGKISLFLPGQDGEKPYHLRLEGVRLALQNISRTEPVSLDMSVTFANSKKSNLELKGEVMLDGSRLDVTLKGSDISLAPLLGLAPTIKGSDFSSGKLEFEAKIIALEALSRLSSQGTIQLTGLGLPVLGRRVDLHLPYRMLLQREKAGPEAQPQALPTTALVARPPARKGDFRAIIEVPGLSINFLGSPEMKARLAGQLTLDPTKLSGSNISFDLARSRFTGSLSIEPRGEKDFVAFDVATPFMDLDELISLSLPGKKQPQESQGTGVKKRSTRADAWLVSGEFRANKVNYTGLVLEDVRMKVAAKDGLGKAETVGKLAGGSLLHQGEVNFNEPSRPYQTSVEMNGVQVEAVLPWLFPGFSLVKKGVFSGQVHLTGQAGVLPQLWGTLRLSQGQLAGLSFLKKYEEYLGAKTLEAFDFTSAHSDFALKEGLLRLKDTELISPDLAMTGQGKLDLRARQIEYQAILNFAPVLLPQSLAPALADKFLPDEKGWLKVPLRIQGELASPGIALSGEPIQDHD